jgi:hypothetical protein
MTIKMIIWQLLHNIITVLTQFKKIPYSGFPQREELRARIQQTHELLSNGNHRKSQQSHSPSKLCPICQKTLLDALNNCNYCNIQIDEFLCLNDRTMMTSTGDEILVCPICEEAASNELTASEVAEELNRPRKCMYCNIKMLPL